ncbi:hypothetical protein KY285_007208 [Solanum tuberosum]|nr:hypothetical protein KY285_007208 [Solanum tuberosum]
MLRLAIHEKLLTKDKLLKWGVVQEAKCSFCNTTNESIAHLMFECNISAGVWKRQLVWQGVTRQVLDWQGEVLWASTHHKGKTPDVDQVYRMTMASAVYHIWQERNARIFKQKQRSEEEIVKTIIQEIHHRGNMYSKLRGTLARLNFYPS